MRNWSSIEEVERGTRNSFLINRKPTETEIYQAKSLLVEMQEIATTIGATLRISRACRSISDPRSEIKWDTVRLLSAYDSLDRMLKGNECLQLMLVFDITNAGKRIRRILERTVNSSSGRADNFQTRRI